MKRPVYAENIKAMRKARGWTQSRLGMEINYSTDVISRWERGDAVPGVFAFVAMARVFNTSVDKIIGNMRSGV